MIVVDTNIIAYLFIMGDKTKFAQQVYEHDTNWIVPTLWQHEFLNVLATFVLHGGGNIDNAINIWQQSQQFFKYRERDINMSAALQLAVENEISAYDAQYVALANSSKCLLVSEDRRLVSKFPNRVLSMQGFIEMGG